jgi:hypothetical protein
MFLILDFLDVHDTSKAGGFSILVVLVPVLYGMSSRSFGASRPSLVVFVTYKEEMYVYSLCVNRSFKVLVEDMSFKDISV